MFEQAAIKVDKEREFSDLKPRLRKRLRRIESRSF
jgi:hypothetical protein